MQGHCAQAQAQTAIRVMFDAETLMKWEMGYAQHHGGNDWAEREKRLRDKRPVLDAIDGTSSLAPSRCWPATSATWPTKSCQWPAGGPTCCASAWPASTSTPGGGSRLPQGRRTAGRAEDLRRPQPAIRHPTDPHGRHLRSTGRPDGPAWQQADIFPRKWCEDAKLPRKKWNSVINKAPLAAETNLSIGGDAPPV